jgi:nucleoside diphosphate kinase
VLGGDVASIESDRARMQGQRRTVPAIAARAPTHVITMSDGSSIKEFVTPGGVVFAVSWSTRFKPRLEQLLGIHAGPYAAAARQALATPGIRHSFALDQDDLVIHASGHLNAHVGVAYLRSLVPEGVRVDELR